MKKTLLLLSLLTLGGWQTIAAQDSKVLDLNFTSSGIQNSAPANAYPPGASGATVLYDPIRDAWLGVSDQTHSNCFHFRYDLDDPIGKAFKSGKTTWEFLFRLDKTQGNSYSSTATGNNDYSGTVKVFSSEQTGGWSFIHYPQTKKFYLEYGTQNESNANKYCKFYSGKDIVTGKFYHIVCTINTEGADKDNAVNFYINGEKCTVTPESGDEFYKTPFMVNTGSPKGTTGMWGTLGGDVQGWTTSAAGLDNPNRSTFVFARVYNKTFS